MLFSSAVDAAMMASRIDQSNAAELIQTGPDAIGGIGDWFISNGTLCAVISDVSHEGEFSSKGGTLIDLGFCDRADDHFTTAQDLLGDQSRPIDIEKVTLEKGSDWVSVVTIGHNDGVELETRYTFKEQQPTQLSVSKRLTVVAKGKEFNFFTPLWFNYHSLESFVFSSKDLSGSKGFNNIDYITRGSSAISEASHNADTLVLLSPPEAEEPISYAWQVKSARRTSGDTSYAVPTFVLSDEESTNILVLADSFYIGDGSDLGLLQLLQIPLLSMDIGDQLELEEVFYVGKRADVASVTDQMLMDAPLITGRLEDPTSALHVDFADGAPFTFVRPVLDGSFAFRAPADRQYRLRHLGSANRNVEHELVVQQANKNIGLLKLSSPATLSLPVGTPMRLVFVGINGTENPDFDDRLTGFSIADDDNNQHDHHRKKVSQVFLAGVASDPKQVELAPGQYRVYATRGPEYSLSVTEVMLKAGTSSKLKIDIPQHVVKTPGYIAADLHVHSGLSFDNTFSTAQRVRTFVAEHGEVMVSSEHDIPTDFTPYIEQVGVVDKIVSVDAVEMTSLMTSGQQPYTGGHVNFFPFTPKPQQFRNGMINHESKRLREVLAEVRNKQPEVVAQLNHARTNLELSGELPEDWQQRIDNGQYLEHMGVAAHPYNPNIALHQHPNKSLIEADPKTGLRDIDFDAMEIMNGGGKAHLQRIQALRKDWLSFLKQGERITGTANSDSHHANEQVAVPRNMVKVRGDNVATFEQTEFLEAIRNGNSYGTSGPMLDILLSDGASNIGIGETFKGAKGVLTIKVSSADWIPIDTIRVQNNGVQIAEFNVDQQMEFSLDYIADKDSFITVDVFGQASEGYKAVYPELTPYAFSNPIYVDYDGDGKITPSGL